MHISARCCLFIQELQETQARAREEAENASATISDLQNALKAKQDDYSLLETTHQSVVDATETAAAEKANADEKIATLQRRCRELESDINVQAEQHSQAMDDLRSELNKDGSRELSEKLKSVQEEHEKQVKALEASASKTLKRRVSEAVAEANAEAKRREATASERSAQLQADLQGQISDLKQQLQNETTNQSTAHAKAISRLKDELLKQNELWEERCAKIRETAAEDAESQRLTHMREVESLEAEKSKIQADCGRQTARVTELEMTVESLKGEVAHLQRQKASLMEGNNAQVSKLQLEIQSLKKELDRGEEARDLRDQLRQKSLRQKEIVQEVRILKHQVHSVKTVHRNLQQLAKEHYDAASTFQEKVHKEIKKRVASHARKLRARACRNEGRLRDQLEASEASRRDVNAQLDDSRRNAEADSLELRTLRRSLAHHEGESKDNSHKSNLDRAARLRLERLYARARHEAEEAKGEHQGLIDQLTDMTSKYEVCMAARIRVEKQLGRERSIRRQQQLVITTRQIQDATFKGAWRRVLSQQAATLGADLKSVRAMMSRQVGWFQDSFATATQALDKHNLRVQARLNVHRQRADALQEKSTQQAKQLKESEQFSKELQDAAKRKVALVGRMSTGLATHQVTVLSLRADVRKLKSDATRMLGDFDDFCSGALRRTARKLRTNYKVKARNLQRAVTEKLRKQLTEVASCRTAVTEELAHFRTSMTKTATAVDTKVHAATVAHERQLNANRRELALIEEKVAAAKAEAATAAAQAELAAVRAEAEARAKHAEAKAAAVIAAVSPRGSGSHGHVLHRSGSMGSTRERLESFPDGGFTSSSEADVQQMEVERMSARRGRRRSPTRSPSHKSLLRVPTRSASRHELRGMDGHVDSGPPSDQDQFRRQPRLSRRSSSGKIHTKVDPRLSIVERLPEGSADEVDSGSSSEEVRSPLLDQQMQRSYSASFDGSANFSQGSRNESRDRQGSFMEPHESENQSPTQHQSQKLGIGRSNTRQPLLSLQNALGGSNKQSPTKDSSGSPRADSLERALQPASRPPPLRRVPVPRLSTVVDAQVFLRKLVGRLKEGITVLKIAYSPNSSSKVQKKTVRLSEDEVRF